MTTEKRLIEFDGCGTGPQGTGPAHYFARCFVCQATTPPVRERDDLRVLAAAKAKGWRAVRQANGRFRLTCPACVRRGR